MVHEQNINLEHVDEHSAIELVICPICGAEISVDVRECEKCGEPQLNYLESSEGSGLWRDHHLLVARKDAVFPDRCLKTNKPAKGMIYRQSFYWHSPAMLITLAGLGFICLIVLVVHLLSGVALLVPLLMVAFFLQQSATLEMGILPKLRSEIRTAKFVCRAFIFFSFFATFGSLAVFHRTENKYYALFLSVAVLVITLIFYKFSSQFMRATNITKGYVWIKGVHASFLKDLPEWERE